MPILDTLNVATQTSLGLAAGILAVIVAAVFYYEISQIDIQKEADKTQVPEGTDRAELRRQFDRVEKLSALIREGAMAFLHMELRYLAVFAGVMAIVIAVALMRDTDNDSDGNLFGLYTMICYLVSTAMSFGAGYTGMLVATLSNGKTTVRSMQSMAQGLRVSFASGAVMSNAVCGYALVSLAILYIIFGWDKENAWAYLSGYALGGPCTSIFTRVGGGIFTKAADVGADLVGKVEAAIPEDDPRNPATIADLVGDNVGDVAGMGADLYGSFAGGMVAAATLATTVFAGDDNEVRAGIATPFWIAGAGMVASFIGIAVVRYVPIADNATLGRLLDQINYGITTTAVLIVFFTAFVTMGLWGPENEKGWKIFGSIIIGLAAGVIIGKWTEYVTSYENAPTKGISTAAAYGGAPVIIKGLGVGMLSVTTPTIILCITIIACNALSGAYGIAIASVGMLSSLSMTLATDAFGPVADNAGGIAELAGLPDFVRTRTDALDSLGNTTAATGKGFAVGSAVLSVTGVLIAFIRRSNLAAGEGISIGTNVHEPIVLAGVLLGVMMPFIFAALTMLSVDKASRSIIREVRLQFLMAPGLLAEDGDRFATYTVQRGGEEFVVPNPRRCVGIATTAAVQEMIMPGVLGVSSVIVIGFLLGPKGLTGMLAGALGSTLMLALTMSNAGGAWDNAKKYVEKCAKEGEHAGQDGFVFTQFGLKKQNVLLNNYVRKASGDKELDGNGHPVGQRPWEEFGLTGADAASEEVVRQKAAELEELYHDRHSAAVTGDTVGDPFKDTSGPSLNVLLKLMGYASLVAVPAFAGINEPNGLGDDGWWIALIISIIIIFVLAGLTTRFQQVYDAEDEEFETIRKEYQEKFDKAKREKLFGHAEEGTAVAAAAGSDGAAGGGASAVDVEAAVDRT